MTVLLIALIPALAVIVTIMMTDSKFWTTIVALVAAAVGVFTGNPIYAFLDFALVAGAYWLAIDSLPTGKHDEVDSDIVDQVGESYDARVAAMELASAQRAAKKIELRAKMLAQLAAQAAEPAAAPQQRKGKLTSEPIDDRR